MDIGDTGNTGEIGENSQGDTARRAFIRGAALTAGLVWVSPVVQSFSTPAHAGGSAPPCGESFWFVYKLGAGGRVGIQSWLTGPTPPPEPCVPGGFSTAEHDVMPLLGTSPGTATFMAGGASGSITITRSVASSTVTITFTSTGCSLAAMARSEDQCLPFSAGAAPGTMSATVSNLDDFTVTGVICC